MVKHGGDGGEEAILGGQDEVVAGGVVAGAVVAGGVHGGHDVHCGWDGVEDEHCHTELMKCLSGWVACICLEYPVGRGTDQGQMNDKRLATESLFGHCC